jgi:hypothetical protein
MRVLILTSSPFDKLTIPQLADEQIIAGPDWPDAQDLEGRWLSLRAPTGFQELDIVLSKIPDYQWPDQIVFLRNTEQSTALQAEVFDVPLVA